MNKDFFYPLALGVIGSLSCSAVSHLVAYFFTPKPNSSRDVSKAHVTFEAIAVFFTCMATLVFGGLMGWMKILVWKQTPGFFLGIAGTKYLTDKF